MNILKFSASWCSPCKTMKPIFEEISKMEKYESYHFIEIDVEDENIIEKFNMSPDDLCQKFQIRNIPALIIADDELHEHNKMVGSADKNKIMDFIEKTLLS